MLLDIELTQFRDRLLVKKHTEKKIDRLDVFDPIRKKYVAFQPEEMVRQLFLHYLLLEKKYPLSRLRVEKGLIVNELQKRCDILVFDKKANPWLLVECKSAKVQMNQLVFDQIARYNLAFRVPFLVVTNGLETYCCQMNYDAPDDTQKYIFLKELPDFDILNQG